MARKSRGSRVYEVKFVNNEGRESSFFTNARSQQHAKKKIKNNGSQILWIRKVRK